MIAIPSQTVGPFFHLGLAPAEASGHVPCQKTTSETTGERMRLHVRVIDGVGAPVPDALLELYPVEPGGADRFTGFGRLATDQDGSCVFEASCLPPAPEQSEGDSGLAKRQAGPTDRARQGQARHLTVCLFARGLLRHLYTRIYFDGDPGLEEDPILALVPADRRRTLLASRSQREPGTWEFEIRLQGEHETVFFDL